MQSNEPSSDSLREVLLLETPEWDQTESVFRRVKGLGAKVTVIPDLDEAQRLIHAHDHDFGALLIPTSVGSDVLRKLLKALMAEPRADGLTLVSVGPPPGRAERRRLRKAGLSLALWEPTNDAIFRFQINRALNLNTGDLNKRVNPRVPTQLRCVVRAGHRDKETSVYSLSTSGAFLETARASMSGGHVDLEIRVMDHIIRTRATVVFANVTGNLQRPSLPLGMAVRFSSLSKDDRNRLGSFIEHVLEELTV